ncbi:4646_t:CDS:1, partial [Acaulospora morrowiae]
QYISDLETRLDNQTKEQAKDHDLIISLKSKITQLKSNESNNEGYIHDLETKLAKNEEQLTELAATIDKLEKKLQQREFEYQELEKVLKLNNSDQEKTLLLKDIDERDKRISQLEQQVELLLNELEDLKRLSEIQDEEIDNFHSRDVSSFSITSESSGSSIPNLTNGRERLIVETLEARLSELQKTHDITVNDLNDMKSRYQECLSKINELYLRLAESQSEELKNYTPSTPMTPISPTSSVDRMSLPPTFIYSELNKEFLGKANDASRFISHRKSKSLSNEIKGHERRELAHFAVVQRLQNELNQLSSLHEDKAHGLDAIKQEFARLEICYREALEVIEELREEIKKRDALAQLEVMSMITPSEHNIESHSLVSSDVDQLEVVQRLREEIEQLKEEQRMVMENISELQTVNDETSDVSRIESSIKELREELHSNSEKTTDGPTDDNARAIELESRIKELELQLSKAQDDQRQQKILESISRLEGFKPVENENSIQTEEDDEKMFALKQQVEKLQASIESKSHTIAALLLPTSEHQNTISRLEDELQEVREAYRLATKGESVVKLGTIPEASEGDENKERSVQSDHNSNHATSSDKLEQNVDENVRALEDRVKDLEGQLAKAKEAQHIPTPRNSVLHLVDPTQKIFNVLQAKLSALQDFTSKSGETQDLKTEQELITSLQTHLETLKVDIRRKYELIEVLKRELVDKGMLNQKLREKESEAIVIQSQLLQYKSREESMKKEITELQAQLEKLNSGKGADEYMQNEIEAVRQELKLVKERELVTMDRIKTLDAEIERMRQVEVTQKERIAVLESGLAEKGYDVDDDLIKLRTELALVKEAEIVNGRTISDLERRLSESLNVKNVQEDSEELAIIKGELEESKATDSILRKAVEELEQKLTVAEKQSQDLQMMREEVTSLKDIEFKQNIMIEQLKSQIQETSDEKEAAIKAAQYIKDDFTAQKELVIALESELVNLNEKCLEAKKQDEASKKELEKLRQQRDQHEKRIKELESEIELLKASIEVNNNDASSLKIELANAKLEMNARNQLVSEMGNQMMSIEKERDQLAERLAELANTLETKESERKEAIKTLESKITDLQSQLEEVGKSSKLDKETIADLSGQLAI